jgi:hypothetical protein
LALGQRKAMGVTLQKRDAIVCQEGPYKKECDAIEPLLIFSASFRSQRRGSKVRGALNFDDRPYLINTLILINLQKC